MFVICFGIVVSVYLFARNSKNIPLLSGNDVQVSANPYININKNTNTDWQKVLTNVDPGLNNTTTVLGSNDPNQFDETSVTAQLSRDVFSRYLLVANQPGGITTDAANQIADQTLSNNQYTQVAGAVYSEMDLHIVSANSDNIKKYTDEMNLILKNRSSQVKVNPLEILSVATQNEDEQELTKLDPIILTAKNFINDLVGIQVPQDAVQVHLDIINSSSNMLSDLEAIRALFTDPVKGLSGVSQYTAHLANFQTAVENMSTYLNSRN